MGSYFVIYFDTWNNVKRLTILPANSCDNSDLANIVLNFKFYFHLITPFLNTYPVLGFYVSWF